MKIFLIILTLLLAVVLQISLAPFLSVFGVVPNLVLVLILFLVVLKGFGKIWWLVVLTGFFSELFSGFPFGLISLSLVSAAYLVDYFNRRIFSGVKFWIINSLIVLGSLAYGLFLFSFSG
jgi:rod shape-determining protein MreD